MPLSTVEASPVAQGLFQQDGSTTRLIGTRCTSCGAHYFPTSLSCRNPACRDKKIEPALLGPHGTLYSYTLQAYRPPALFRMEPWAPYLIGLVELPEGIRVMGMLTGCTPEDVRIGMAVELCAQALYRDDDGREVLTYKFRPATVADEGGAR